MAVVTVLFQPHINEEIFLLVSFEDQGVDFRDIFVQVLVNNESAEHRYGLLNVFFCLNEDDFHGGLIDHVLADGFVHFQGPGKRFALMMVGGAIGVEHLVDVVKNRSEVGLLET